MKRSLAAVILAALTVPVILAACLAPRGGGLVGSWETEVELAADGAREGETSARLRFTFAPDGTYICAVALGRESLDSGARLQGSYAALRDRLFFSQGLDSPIDPEGYDRYRLEGDALILLGGADGDVGGFYPLTLTRVAGE